MSGDLVAEQEVFLLRASAYVVDDERSAVGGTALRDQADVGYAAAEIPCHDIAGKVIGRFLGDRLGITFACEIGHQVWDTAVVNVAVRLLESPVLWVSREVLSHVLVDFLLQVEGLLAEGADDHVGADPAFHRDIAAGVGEGAVGGIVGFGDTDLAASGSDEFRSADLGGGAEERNEKQETSNNQHRTPNIESRSTDACFDLL